MSEAEKILEKYPKIKVGIDDFYGKQTVLNAINEALHIHGVGGIFYCIYKDDYLLDKCKIQCRDCILREENMK